MQVHYDYTRLPEFRNAVLTIGTFDGVHAGHRQILRMMQEQARKNGGETVIITFHPHPRHIIAANQSRVFLLNSIQEKIARLSVEGIDHLVVIPFTESFSLQPAANWVTDFLVRFFKPSCIIIGHDHRFGNSRKGDIHLLQSMAPDCGFCVKEIPEFMLENSSISSTRIREALLKGEAALAMDLLGYPYQVCGTIVLGNQLGRTLGFPTANVQPFEDDKLIPGNGVYAVKAEVHSPVSGERIQRNAMMNIGVRPTVEGTRRMIEVHLFDFDALIYDWEITVSLFQRLRNEQKFENLDALKLQLNNDRQQAKQYFDEHQID